MKYFIFVIIFVFSSIFNSYSNELKIISNKLEIDRSINVSVFTGNVNASNDEIKIWSQILTLKSTNNLDEIEEIRAKDNVKIMIEGIEAFGEEGIYIPSKSTVKLKGNVKIVRNESLITCDELMLDLNNSTSIMTSNSEKRVEAVIIEN